MLDHFVTLMWPFFVKNVLDSLTHGRFVFVHSYYHFALRPARSNVLRGGTDLSA